MSGFVESLLQRLDTEMRDHAVSALSAPSNRDDFEYGRVCGLYAGLSRTRDILMEMLRDADAENDRL